MRWKQSHKYVVLLAD